MTLLAKTLWISAALLAAMLEGERGSNVRVVPVDRTPEPDSAQIKIVYPRENEVETDNPIGIQLRLETYALG
ncbi:MAG: hypothetical protein ACRDFB_09080, partial [Rhabdochlamydiaceae bacterium]